MNWAEFLSDEETLVFMIPIVAILTGGVIGIVTLVLKHRERMSMIDQGIHPDYPPEDEDSQEEPPPPP